MQPLKFYDISEQLLHSLKFTAIISPIQLVMFAAGVTAHARRHR